MLQKGEGEKELHENMCLIGFFSLNQVGHSNQKEHVSKNLNKLCWWTHFLVYDEGVMFKQLNVKSLTLIYYFKLNRPLQTKFAIKNQVCHNSLTIKESRVINPSTK